MGRGERAQAGGKAGGGRGGARQGGGRSGQARGPARRRLLLTVRPVPSTITSYSSFMAARGGGKNGAPGGERLSGSLSLRRPGLRRSGRCGSGRKWSRRRRRREETAPGGGVAAPPPPRPRSCQSPPSPLAIGSPAPSLGGGRCAVPTAAATVVGGATRMRGAAPGALPPFPPPCLHRGVLCRAQRDTRVYNGHVPPCSTAPGGAKGARVCKGHSCARAVVKSVCKAGVRASARPCWCSPCTQDPSAPQGGTGCAVEHPWVPRSIPTRALL